MDLLQTDIPMEDSLNTESEKTNTDTPVTEVENVITEDEKNINVGKTCATPCSPDEVASPVISTEKVKPVRTQKQKDSLANARNSLARKRTAKQQEEDLRNCEIQKELNSLLKENQSLRLERTNRMSVPDSEVAAPPPRKAKPKHKQEWQYQDSSESDGEIERNPPVRRKRGSAGVRTKLTPQVTNNLMRSFGF